MRAFRKFGINSCRVQLELSLRSFASFPKDDTQACVRRSATGLLVGIYSQNDGRHDTAYMTKSAEKYNKRTCGALHELLRLAGPCPKLGETRIFYGLEPQFTAVAVVGLGPICTGYDEGEGMDLTKENIRVAAGAGARALEPLALNRLYLESFGDAGSAAEGAGLGLWCYQQMKTPSKRIVFPTIELFDDCDWTGWAIGLEKAAAQNLARRFAATPANIMTPIAFSQTAVEVLCKTGVNVEVKVRDWAEIQGMGGFLAVAKGSCQEPIFLELSYYGTGNIKDRPIVFVGKGCTFDSGGICRRNMRNMWGDVTGAASIVATIRAAASLQLPVNIRGLIPLVEHMPGCNAMKPGDVVTSFNGKNILVQDTRCEGRLLMADALSYAQTFQPRCIVDVGTLTQGVQSGLSSSSSAVFTNSERLWTMTNIAAAHTGDRVWRLPLFRHYCKKMAISSSVDLKGMGWYGPNSATSRGVCGGANPQAEWSGEPCRAAAFLREFVPCGEWLHIDNFGVMHSDGVTDPPYLRAGMTGRPTRTMIELLYQLNQNF